MLGDVYWKNPGYRERPRLVGDASCDILIVGGGVTGVSCAYFLSKYSRKKVILVEKSRIASGATGRAAGMLTAEGELFLEDAIRLFGRHNGLLFWYYSIDAIHAMKQVAKEEKIDCELEPENEVFAEYRGKTHYHAMREYGIRKEAHLRVNRILRKDLYRHFRFDAFKDAIMMHEGASINPLKYTQNLSAHIRRVRVFENTPLIRARDGIATTPRGKIKYKRIIYATDSGDGRRGVTLKKTTVALTNRLSKRQIKKLDLKEKIMLWDSKEGYDYFKFTKDWRVLAGFGWTKLRPGESTTSLHRQHLRQIRRFINELFPEGGLRIEHAWSGSFTTTRRFVPVIYSRGDGVHISATSSQVVSTMLAKYVALKLSGKASPLDALYGRRIGL